MTTPNPFAQQAPAAVEQQSAQPNPFGNVPAAPTAAPAPGNPFPQQQATPAPAQAFPPQAAQPQQPNPFPAYGQQATYGAPQAAPAPVAQQQYAAPAPVAQAAPPQFDMNRFGAAPPPSPTGGKGAQLADMYGRLVILFPLREETVPRRPEHITAEQRAAGNVNQQKLTATVVVLDQGPGSQPGGSIAWGGNPHQFGGQPHTNNDPLPYVRKSMWLNQTKIIEQARLFMPQTPGGAPGMLVGRVAKAGPQQNDPWFIATASEQEMDLARTYINLVTQGAYPHPLAP